MILIVGTVRLPADATERARPAMAAMLTASRAEDGCLTYAYAQDVLDPGLIHVVERWRDRAALDAHLRTAHMADWRAVWSDLGIGDRDLAMYETDDGRPI